MEVAFPHRPLHQQSSIFAVTWLRIDPEWKRPVGLLESPWDTLYRMLSTSSGGAWNRPTRSMMRRMWKFIRRFRREVPGHVRDCGNFSFTDLPSAKSTAYVFPQRSDRQDLSPPTWSIRNDAKICAHPAENFSGSVGLPRRTPTVRISNTPSATPVR